MSPSGWGPVRKRGDPGRVQGLREALAPALCGRHWASLHPCALQLMLRECPRVKYYIKDTEETLRIKREHTRAYVALYLVN